MKFAFSTLAAAGILAASLCFQAAPAEGHALWKTPMPRDDQDGYKPGRPGFELPCGIERGNNQPSTTLKAGSMQMVEWTETVNHPGCFLIDFATSDDAEQWQLLKNVDHTTMGGTPRAYSTMIELPAEACTNCILRLRQVMLGNENATCPPANLNDNSPTLYYSCANIVLEADAPADAGAPDASGMGGMGGASGMGGMGGATGMGGMGGDSGGMGGAAAGSGAGGAGGSSSPGEGGSSAGGSGGSSSAGQGGSSSGGSSGGSAGSSSAGSRGSSSSSGSGGCAVAGNGQDAGGLGLLLLGLGLLLRRRRRAAA